MSWPALLSANVNVAEGATQGFDSERLSNTFDSPMLVDEIRFTLRTPDTSATNFAFADLSGSLRVKLTMNGHPMTTQFVPIGLLGPKTTDIHLASWSNTSIINFARYVWKFRRPLLVPANGTIEALVSRTTDGVGGNANVDIAYAGRVLAKNFVMPKSIDVPFAAAFVASTNVATFISLERALLNPFRVPLQIYGLVGGINYATAAASPSGSIFWSNEASTTCAVKISRGSMSGNVDMMKGFIPFPQVFDAERLFWPLNCELAPRERFIVSFQSAPVETGNSKVILMVNAIGYRSEEI